MLFCCCYGPKQTLAFNFKTLNGAEISLTPPRPTLNDLIKDKVHVVACNLSRSGFEFMHEGMWCNANQHIIMFPRGKMEEDYRYIYKAFNMSFCCTYNGERRWCGCISVKAWIGYCFATIKHLMMAERLYVSLWTISSVKKKQCFLVWSTTPFPKYSPWDNSFRLVANINLLSKTIIKEKPREYLFLFVKRNNCIVDLDVVSCGTILDASRPGRRALAWTAAPVMDYFFMCTFFSFILESKGQSGQIAEMMLLQRRME
jgi:hypothetical protein